MHSLIARAFAGIASLALVACAEPAPRVAEGGRGRAEPATPATSTPTAAPSASGISAIPYDLPKAGEVPDLPPPEPEGNVPEATTHQQVSTVFVVSLEADGSMTVNGSPITDDKELVRLARLSLDKDPDVRAVIKADRRVSWGQVIHVLDGVKIAGIAKIAFAVSPVSP